MRLTRRRLIGGGLTTVAATVGAVSLADGNPDPQALLLTFMAQERAYNRLPPVVGNPGLQAQAELQAARLAASGDLWHTPRGELDWWVNPDRPGALVWVGEIVGYAHASEVGLLSINQGWIRSDRHREIMLKPDARLIGVGVRVAGATAWASAMFGI